MTKKKDLRATKAVLEMDKINLTGNVIPHTWYEKITFENGKPNLVAIIILSEICYWYRPTIVRDERTGRVLEYRKKFHADQLQRQYKEFAEQFGVSARQAKAAIDLLVEMGLITREFRTVTGNNGKPVNNLMFVEVIPGAIEAITYPPEGIELSTGEEEAETVEGEEEQTPPTIESKRVHPPGTIECKSLLQSNVGRIQEITTENIITSSCSNNAREEKNADDEKTEKTKPKVDPIFNFMVNDMRIMPTGTHAEWLRHWGESFNDEVILYAMKETVLANKYTLSYTEGILRNWLGRNVKTVEDAVRIKLERIERETTRSKRNDGIEKHRGSADASDEYAEYDFSRFV